MRHFMEGMVHFLNLYTFWDYLAWIAILVFFVAFGLLFVVERLPVEHAPKVKHAVAVFDVLLAGLMLLAFAMFALSFVAMAWNSGVPEDYEIDCSLRGCY